MTWSRIGEDIERNKRLDKKAKELFEALTHSRGQEEEKENGIKITKNIHK